MHADTMSMVSDTFGKKKDICLPGDDYAIAYTAYVENQAKIAVAVTQEAGSTTRTLGAIVGTVEVAKSYTSSSTNTTTTTDTTNIETTSTGL
jgi:predicted GH43/DUF377 family glycosyl hydrolase